MRLMAVFVALGLLAACTPASQATPTPARAATATRPAATSDQYPTSVAIDLTATPSIDNGGPELAGVPFGYRFLYSLADLAGREVVVYLDPEASRFNYLTWDGGTGPLLEVDLPRDVETGTPYFHVAPVSHQARYVVLSVDPWAIEPWPGWQLYVFDLLAMEAWGYASGCPGDGHPQDEFVGPEYLTYTCGDERIRFVSLVSPSTAYARDVPEELGQRPVPFWLSSGEILLLDRERTFYCVGQVEAWHPACWTVPFMLGGISPDGEWVEVREGEWWSPERIGVWPGRCLQDPSAADCEPQWVRVQGVIADWPPPFDAGSDTRSIWGPGAWLPDGSGLIVLNAEEQRGGVDSSREVRVGSDPWILHLKDMSLEPLRRIPYPELNYPSAGDETSLPVFAPAGDYLLLEDYVGAHKAGGALYLVSLTGQPNRVLLERAGQRIGTLSVP
jgi:hypothetical protein